jgi:hypothetical protein
MPIGYPEKNNDLKSSERVCLKSKFDSKLHQNRSLSMPIPEKGYL